MAVRLELTTDGEESAIDIQVFGDAPKGLDVEDERKLKAGRLS